MSACASPYLDDDWFVYAGRDGAHHLLQPTGTQQQGTAGTLVANDVNGTACSTPGGGGRGIQWGVWSEKPETVSQTLIESAAAAEQQMASAVQ